MALRNGIQVLSGNYTLQTTLGDGGRKIVRLSNGWFVTAILGASSILYYVSKDDGATWTQLCYSTASSLSGWALASYGTTVYCIISVAAATTITLRKFDASTVSNIDQTAASTIDTAQTAFGNGCSIVSDSTGILHACWTSKNSNYPNSFNLRYSKSTDGGITWATPTQLYTLNTAGQNDTNPSIAVRSNGYPFIAFEYVIGSTYFIAEERWNGTTWNSSPDVTPSGLAYAQSNACTCITSDDVIHVVWQGKDATDSSVYNIRYSKSTDLGVSWSTPLKLTSGNTYDQTAPTITRDKNNVLYVTWSGNDSSTKGQIKKMAYVNGSWSGITTFTNNATYKTYQVSSCMNYTDFTDPICVYIEDGVSVKFRGGFVGADASVTADTYIANTAYDTSDNGQRKLVKLSNGWLIAMVVELNTRIRFYKSTDNGVTWTYLCFRTITTSTYFTSITSYNNTVYYALTTSTSSGAYMGKFDATIVSNADQTSTEVTMDTSQTALNDICIISDAVGTLYSAWTSTNATYPNSWNIRYSKSTNGGASWAAPTQITTLNTNNFNYASCHMVLTSANNPVIVSSTREGASAYYVRSFTYTGSVWNAVVTVESAGIYPRGRNSVVTDTSGIIHAVFFGADSTDSAKNNVRYSKSTDNGATWSSALKLTSGNAYDQNVPSICYNSAGDLAVVFSGGASGFAARNIKVIKYSGGSWGSAAQVTNECGASNLTDPSTISYFGSLTDPAFIYADTSVGAVKYFNSYLAVTATVTMNSLNYAALAWTISNPVGGAITACRLKINGTLKQTYTTGLTSPLSYTINISDLNVGSNTITIEADVVSVLATTKSLTASKVANSWSVDETTFSVNGYLSIVGASSNESYIAATKTNSGLTANTGENQLIAVPGTGAKITEKLTLTRSSSSIDKGLTKITGALG
jgi:hypothetical protein